MAVDVATGRVRGGEGGGRGGGEEPTIIHDAANSEIKYKILDSSFFIIPPLI
jgi:hypothetical protein